MRDPFSAGSDARVVLVKADGLTVEYGVEVLHDDGNHLVVRGPWAGDGPRDLGFATFRPGDVFTEHYWRDRWYSVKEVRDGSGALKGWYCDVARPAWTERGRIISEDLVLDLWVAPDGRTLRLDEDEFATSGLAEADPFTAPRARSAVDELEHLARNRFADLDLERGT